MTRALLLPLVFLVAFLAALVLRAPLETALRLAPLERYDVSYLSAEGTVWRGLVRGLAINGRAVGDVQINAEASALLGGVLASDIRVASQGLNGRGRLGIGLLSGTLHAEGVTLSGPVRDLRGLSPFLRQSAGELRLTVPRARFAPDGRCETLDGVVETDLLQRLTGLAWSGPPVSGDWSCSDGHSVFTFLGDQSGENVRGTLTVRPDRAYAVDMVVVTSEENARAILPAMGFEPGEAGWTFRREGRL